MFQRTLFGCLLALCCLTLTGCGDSHESLMKESISMMNSLAADIESGMPEDKLKSKYEAQGKSLQERAKKLGEPSAAEGKRLKEKYEPEMAKAAQKMMEAAVKKGGGLNPQAFGF